MMQPLPSRYEQQPTRRHGLALVSALPAPRYSTLALWHLLSLDAPSVAALWTYFVARCCRLSLPWTASAAMFLAVWMLYATDRLLDARHGNTPELEERHRFHHRHKQRFLIGIVGASIALAALLPRLEQAPLRLYALLASLLFAYFFLIHIYPSNTSPANIPRRLPKELAVGLFFSAAIFIPTVARAPQLRLPLLPCALLFAAVCTLNCLYLYAWEHPGSRSSAHWTTRFATRNLRLLTVLTISCAAASLLVSRSVAPATNPLPAVACGLSAALLLGLHALRRRLTAIHLRTAADLALLTPLLLLPFAR
jgi:hypothetical protein